MKKIKENFKVFKDEKIDFLFISFKLIIFTISLIFLIESIF
ncbi:MAG: hypothetical protein ACJA2M_002667 [Polaribacter sp.]|jgi:hypothetical protein